MTHLDTPTLRSILAALLHALIAIEEARERTGLVAMPRDLSPIGGGCD